MALSLEKVIITDNLDGGCRTYLEESGIAVDVKESLSKEDLVREIAVSGPFFNALQSSMHADNFDFMCLIDVSYKC